MKKIINKSFGSFTADAFKYAIASSHANVYVMLSRAVNWANVSNSSNFDDSYVPYPYETVEYKNDVAKKGIILKKINTADIQAVLPRTDWASGVVYTAYDQTANLFLKTSDLPITGGNVNVSVSLANTITTTNVTQLNLAFSTPSIGLNDFIKIGEEVKEVIKINSAGDFIQVNSNFSSAYTQNTLYLVEYSGNQYYNKFYVRNDQDQVFKCLFNNNGAASTIKPEIILGGQLPENPYIETSDGYKWKYMYTISSGQKSKFFTEKYMPVTTDTVVVNSANSGRIDIVQILNSGNGYYQGSTINNYPIVSVTGDGTGAVFTVDVLNGAITEVNIINGGLNYSNAVLKITDPLKLPGSANANLRAVISPTLGHGYDPITELGSSELMVSVDFTGTMSGLYPIYGDGTSDYRQIAIVNKPNLSNGSAAGLSTYPMYTSIFVSSPSPSAYTPDMIVYVGTAFSNASFSATVVHFDNAQNILLVNDINGDVTSIEGKQIRDRNDTIVSTVFSYTKPDINILSGDILYIENREKISRNSNQTETAKIVIEF